MLLMSLTAIERTEKCDDRCGGMFYGVGAVNDYVGGGGGPRLKQTVTAKKEKYN